MTSHDEDDIEEAVICTEIREYPYADVRFLESVAVGEQDDITINDNYTSGGSTSAQDIFAGRVKHIEFMDETEAECVSEAEDIDSIRPDEYFYNYTFANIVYYLINNYSVISTADAGAYINYFYGTYDMDGGIPGDFDLSTNWVYVASILLYRHYGIIQGVSSIPGGDADLIDVFNAGTQGSGTIEMYLYPYKLSGANHSIVDYEIRNSVGVCLLRLRITASATSAGLLTIQWWDGAATYTTIYSDYDSVPLGSFNFPHLRIDFESTSGTYKGLAQYKYDVYLNGVQIGSDIAFSNNVGPAYDLRLRVWNGGVTPNVSYCAVDAIGYSWDSGYTIGQNCYWKQTALKYGIGEYDKIPYINFQADKTLRVILDEYANSVYGGWYLNNDLELLCNDLDVDSGYNLAATDDIISITGEKETIKVDKVVLLGGFIGTTRLRVESGSGNNIKKDTYANILDEAKLQTICDNTLTSKQQYLLTLVLEIKNPTEGMFQVGETMTVGANIPITDTNITTSSPNDITGEYIIRAVEFNTQTKVSHIILDDAIYFISGGPLDQENSELIGQIANRISDLIQWRDAPFWDYSSTGATLTVDGAWHIKDVSAIVPAGYKNIVIALYRNVAANDFFRPYLFTNYILNHVMNAAAEVQLIIPLADPAIRWFEYNFGGGGNAYIQIVGWF